MPPFLIYDVNADKVRVHYEISPKLNVNSHDLIMIKTIHLEG